MHGVCGARAIGRYGLVGLRNNGIFSIVQQDRLKAVAVSVTAECRVRENSRLSGSLEIEAEATRSRRSGMGDSVPLQWKFKVVRSSRFCPTRRSPAHLPVQWRPLLTFSELNPVADQPPLLRGPSHFQSSHCPFSFPLRDMQIHISVQCSYAAPTKSSVIKAIDKRTTAVLTVQCRSIRHLPRDVVSRTLRRPTGAAYASPERLRVGYPEHRRRNR